MPFKDPERKKEHNRIYFLLNGTRTIKKKFLNQTVIIKKET